MEELNFATLRILCLFITRFSASNLPTKNISLSRLLVRLV